VSDGVVRRCPECGKKPADRLLVQCSDCRVPFVYAREADAGLSTAQIDAVARYVLTSWKFWAGVLVVMTIAVVGVGEILEHFIDDRANRKFTELEQKTAGNNSAAFQQISNQINAEFRQPRIRSTIEQVAADRANDFITNSLHPSIETLQAGFDQARSRLMNSSNELAKLEADIKAARTNISQASGDNAGRLTLTDTAITNNGSNYVLTMYFKVTGDLPPGPIDIFAGTYKQTARILSFVVSPPNQAEPAIMSEAGDAARLKLNVVDRAPVLGLELNAATIVKLVSGVFESDITLPVAVDKIHLPAGGN